LCACRNSLLSTPATHRRSSAARRGTMKPASGPTEHLVRAKRDRARARRRNHGVDQRRLPRARYLSVDPRIRGFPARASVCCTRQRRRGPAGCPDPPRIQEPLRAGCARKGREREMPHTPYRALRRPRSCSNSASTPARRAAASRAGRCDRSQPRARGATRGAEERRRRLRTGAVRGARAQHVDSRSRVSFLDGCGSS